MLGEELHRGPEEIVEQTPLNGTEFIEERNNTRISESFIAEPLPDMGPVLLLHMGVIVFVVSPASGKLNGLSSVGKMTQEVVIEKLRAVVTIETPQGKGKGVFNMMDLLKDPGLTFAPHSPLFTPSGGKVDAVDGNDIPTGSGGTAVGYRIGLKESGAGLKTKGLVKWGQSGDDFRS